MDNIGSIEVLKDVSAAGIYGPRAANGVIVLKTKNPGTGRSISFNSCIGMEQRPVVTSINGEYEKAVRRQFYDRYTAKGRYTDDDIKDRKSVGYGKSVSVRVDSGGGCEIK